jgi:hypothetical protein
MTEMLVTPDQVVEIVPEDTQVIAVLDPGSVLVVLNPDQAAVVLVTQETPPVIIEVPSPTQQIAIITEGPQGPPGSGTGSIPESGGIIRDIDGNITEVVLESKTVVISRINGQISSITDGTYTWTFTRALDGSIASWEVT